MGKTEEEKGNGNHDGSVYDDESDYQVNTWAGASDEDEGKDVRPGDELEHKANCRVVTATSVIPKGPHFLEDVRSSLPYREIIKKVPHSRFTSVLIDDERIICYANDADTWVHTM